MKISQEKIQLDIIRLITKITLDWDLEYDELINAETLLVKDLGCPSICIIQLILAIEEKFNQKFGFTDLLMPNGHFVDDLSIAQVVEFVYGHLTGRVSLISQSSAAEGLDDIFINRIDEDKVAHFRQIVPPPVSPSRSSGSKNPQAIFLISAPRSGSTLLRIILAGHPKLFVPPELHLLSYNDLSQRKVSLSSEINSNLLEGAIRAIMQLRNCTAEEAEFFMKEYEDQQMTTKQFYGLMQQWLNDRILVDKTPTYGYHIETLQRAEEEFDCPLYIHLFRHPYGMIRSYEEAKLDRLVLLMDKGIFNRRELAELTWVITEQNIIQFLNNIPKNRQAWIKFEDFVTDPYNTIQKLCNDLGLEFYPDMLDPYRDMNTRMSDGVRILSRSSGDLKFHLHQGIEADAAYRWKQFHTEDFLGDVTWETAKLLGYQRM